MQLRTVDGKLTLGSVYKIVVWGWAIGWGVIFIPFILIFAIGATLSGKISWNGEMIYGSGEVFMHVLPFLLLPLVAIVFHAFTFGGLIALGVLIYRRFRPLPVVAE